MSDSVHVLSIEGLEALDSQLAVFADRVSETLRSVQRGGQNEVDDLQTRVLHWMAKVREGEDRLRHAIIAVERCRASGTRDKDGREIPPNCSGPEREVDQAQRDLRRLKDNLQATQTGLEVVTAGLADHLVQSMALCRQVDTSIPAARAFLKRKADQLRQYASLTGCRVVFGHVAWSENAHYERDSDTIQISMDMEDVGDAEIMKPLLAHERVHARLKTSTPTNEAELQGYLSEEWAAYQAQHESWQEMKDTYYARHADRASIFDAPEGERNLVSAYQALEINFAHPGAFRYQLESTYRERFHIPLIPG